MFRFGRGKGLWTGGEQILPPRRYFGERQGGGEEDARGTVDVKGTKVKGQKGLQGGGEGEDWEGSFSAKSPKSDEKKMTEKNGGMQLAIRCQESDPKGKDSELSDARVGRGWGPLRKKKKKKHKGI